MLKRLIITLLLGVMACLSYAFADTPTLNVYTYRSFTSEWGPGPIIQKGFEAQCHCRINYIALDDAVSILNRLKMEGAKTHADIVIGLDNNLLSLAEQTALFAPHQLDNQAIKLPISWHNNDFYPYDYGYFAFIYNNQKIKNPPTSLHDLINLHSQWRVVYPDPRVSTVGLGLILWMQKVYGHDVNQAWQALSSKTLTIPRGWSEAYSLLQNGEADFALSYTTSPAYHLIAEKNPHFVAAHFKEGHYLQIEVAGVTKTSQHPELAHALIKFMLTPEIQKSIALTNWMMPVIPVKLPDAFHHLIDVKTPLLYSPQEIATHQTEWIRTWQNAISQ